MRYVEAMLLEDYHNGLVSGLDGHLKEHYETSIAYGKSTVNRLYILGNINAKLNES